MKRSGSSGNNFAASDSNDKTGAAKESPKDKDELQPFTLCNPEMQAYVSGLASSVLQLPFISSLTGGTASTVASSVPTVQYTPVVFAGPSGVGKGTIVNKLMEKYPSIFGFSVSHTTRAPRPGEVDGVHYNFVTKDVMEELIAKDGFVEYARVHTNIYGSSFAAVEKVKSEGKVCILDIDIQGVANVKKSNLACKYIFIAPPSMRELEKRLRGRGTETEDKIKVRLANANKELDYGQTPGNFDEFVVNDDLDKTFEKIVGILKDWYPALEL